VPVEGANSPLEKAESDFTICRMAMTRHCWKCGAEYTLPGTPGRSESCHRCNSDLKVCLNCVSYDPRVAEQCRDRRADPVAEKHMANYCEYFEFIRREFVPPVEDTSREAKARDTLKKLLGD
jgi:ribosomal protein L40E